MFRYFSVWAFAGVLALGQWVATQALADDGQVLITREVPYQPAFGPRHTGRVNAVDVSPDIPMTSMLAAAPTRNGNAVTELTDRESSVIASGLQGHTAATASGLQTSAAYEGLAAGKLAGNTGSVVAPTGALGSLTFGIGGSVAGSVGRATDALSNTLNSAMFGAGITK